MTAAAAPATPATPAPRGEDAVRAALIRAGSELFAAQGPANVSVKQVAAAAGVNHGLVHHYFGSKDGLVVAVLESLAEQSAQELAVRGPLDLVHDANGPAARHGRIVAHLILAGEDVVKLKTAFPAVRDLIERFGDRGMSPDDAQTHAAQVLTMALGWQVFETYVAAAAGLQLTDDTRQRVLDDAIRRLTS
jgi:AcrR family transcriptional regulator